EGITTLPGNQGQECLVARVAAGTGLETTRDWHLAVFNDERQEFESVVRWDIHDTHDSAHPFRARVGGIEYLYLYPNFRVRAELEALRDLQRYEAFTCIAGDGKLRGEETAIDRNTAGKVQYNWKAGGDRLHPGVLQKLIRAAKLQPSELWLQL